MVDDDGLGLVHGDATISQVGVTPKSFTGRTSDTDDYDGSALPNSMPTILDSDGLNEVLKAIDDELGVVAGNITTGDAANVSKSLFDANTILKADSDDTPLALTVPEQTLIGRKTGGNIAALAPDDVLLALGITASITELNYVDGVTSAIQTQIDGNDTDITNLQAKFPVVTADVADSAVTNIKIANNAVSNAKLDSSLQTDITQITTNQTNITTLTNLTAIDVQTIFGRRTGDGTAIGLTAAQTLTLLGITVSSTDINRLVGINDDVQVQIDNISDTFGNIDAFDEVTISGMTAPTSVDLTHIIAAGIAFINNKRVVTSDTEHTYTASQDIYVDIDDGGTFTFIEVANGADAPALTTDSIRIMKVVTDVNNITGVTDLRPLDLRIDKLLGRKMDVPSGATATLQAGGSLVDGTELFYVITATDGSGETIQSTEVSETPTGANLTIKIDWSAVTKARFYRIYKRESGIYKLYKEVTAPTITLTDDGSAIFVTSGSPPLFTNAYRAKLEDMGDVTLEIGVADILSGTVGRILFEGTGNILQESSNLVWDTVNDRLGVGQSTPTARVQVKGEGTTSGTSSLILEDSAGTKIFEVRDDGRIGIGASPSFGSVFNVEGTSFFESSGMTLQAVSTSFSFLFNDNGGVPKASIVCNTNVGDLKLLAGGVSEPSDLALICRGVNKFVGIGTAAISGQHAATKLHVRGDTLDGSTIRIEGFEFRGGYESYRANGVAATPTAILDTEVIGSWDIYGHDGTAFGIGAKIEHVAAENWAVGAHGTDIKFSTVPIGGTSLITALTIDNAQLVTIAKDAVVSQHMAIGATASISDNFILRLSETITSNVSSIGINSLVNLSSTLNSISITGVLIGSTMSGTTGGADVKGCTISAHQDVTAGTAPNLEGLSINVTTGSGALSPVTTRVLRIGAPSFVGGKPTTYDGIFIENQGVSGITTSFALNIADQTGSSNNYAIKTGTGLIEFGGRVKQKQGADVASANDLTLGLDGNTFEITGATQLNRIVNTDWQNGSKITLSFSSALTIKHGQASGGVNITILLDGLLDFSATAGSQLKLELSELAGVQAWRDRGRTKTS